MHLYFKVKANPVPLAEYLSLHLQKAGSVTLPDRTILTRRQKNKKEYEKMLSCDALML
jgi:hypothetical protein